MFHVSERALAKKVCSGSLAPHFVNNDYITAEITCSTVCMHTTRTLLVTNYFCRGMSTPPKKAEASTAASHSCVCWASYERREYSVPTAMATTPTRENTVMTANSAKRG